MAFHTAHSRMRRILVRGIFRFHNRVACLAAELIRISMLICFETAERGKSQEDQRAARKECERRAMAGIVEVEFWHMQTVGFAQPYPPMLANNSQKNEENADKKKYRQDDKCDDPHIRFGIFCDGFKKDQKKDQSEAYDGKRRTDQRDKVLKRFREYSFHLILTGKIRCKNNIDNGIAIHFQYVILITSINSVVGSKFFKNSTNSLL